MFWYLVVTKIVLIADLMSEPNLFIVDGPRREVLLSHVGLAQWQFMSRNYDKLLNFVSIVNCFLSFRNFFLQNETSNVSPLRKWIENLLSTNHAVTLASSSSFLLKNTSAYKWAIPFSVKNLSLSLMKGTIYGTIIG